MDRAVVWCGVVFIHFTCEYVPVLDRTNPTALAVCFVLSHHPMANGWDVTPNANPNTQTQGWGPRR